MICVFDEATQASFHQSENAGPGDVLSGQSESCPYPIEWDNAGGQKSERRQHSPLHVGFIALAAVAADQLQAWTAPNIQNPAFVAFVAVLDLAARRCGFSAAVAAFAVSLFIGIEQYGRSNGKAICPGNIEGLAQEGLGGLPNMRTQILPIDALLIYFIFNSCFFSFLV